MYYLQVRSCITDEFYRQPVKESDSLDSIRQVANSLIQEYDIKRPTVSIVKRSSNSNELVMTLPMSI